ncbi:MAG: poly-gamma-glutamate system protein, partial [Oscillospiraceae bacterium]
HEAGIRSGDTVGAGFSGSFPSMNLAVLSACAAMDVRLIYLASVGSSTYGANNPALTFPEMAVRLYEDGLIVGLPARITLGGGSDVGKGMDPTMLAEIEARLEKLPVALLREPDYTANLAARMALYEQNGPIDCFIGVGGNLTTLGRSDRSYSLGQGLIRTRPDYKISDASGLIERYSAAGLPVIHLLNIKKLVAEYGLPFDPATLPAPGESAVYETMSFAAGPALAALALIAAFLVSYKILGRPPRSKRPVE